MRAIKFRAWLTDEKKMIEWSTTFFSDMSPVTGYSGYIEENNEIILMQFTGKYDSEINGNEIFEFDIIENCDTKELQVVYWNENEAAWYCRYVYNKDRIVSLADSLGNLNIKIGNIYENKDLL